ncbi:hypothetical protein [Portibacter marinus]|uniref:hypothetical protein n=1 Tax=Portibacter marinus TaxID=2898660 RepID=UPI001F19500A|nr:hypothetical protein [Portibacter marinus]
MRSSVGLFLVLLLFGGCSLFNEPGSELILNVDNEFEVDIIEHLQPEGRDLRFAMSSINEVMCEESELVLQTAKSSNAINIKINEIAVMDNCNSGMSYPYGEADFKLRNRDYQLSIQVKELNSHFGMLNVSEEEYIITMEDSKGLVLTRNNLQKIPNSFAWGYYQNTANGSSDLISSFLRENNLVVRPLVHLKPGFYSYFSIDSEGNVIIDDLPYSGSIEKIAFDNIDLTKVKDNLSTFKTQNPDLKFTMYFSDGTIL